MLNKDNIRELCYVIVIDAIEPIEGSDNCEAAIVGGWKIMVRKGTFKPGDLGIYFEIDSAVPHTEQYAFLEKKHYKIKTQKYTFGGKNPGFYSQGLLMSAEDFGWTVDRIDELFITDDEMVRHIPGTESAFLTKKLGVTYADPDDNKRKSSSSGDKYKKMAGRHPKLFQNPIIKWIYKKTWGKKLLFVFFGRPKDKNGWPEWVKKTDEERCLIGNTKIDTNIGKVRIADIVNKKMNVLVKSYNFETKIIEYKPIVNYYKYNSENEKIYNIEYSKNYISNRKNRIICTGDHKIKTYNDYKEAKKIMPGDIGYYIHNCYPDEIIQYVYGMFLGDGCISFDKRPIKNGDKLLSPRLSFCQGKDHYEYFKWLAQIFNIKSFYNNDKKHRGFTNKDTYKFCVDIDETITKYLYQDKVIDLNCNLNVTQDFCNRLTPISLAIWYMDDGTLRYHPERNAYDIELSSNAFNREENDLLVSLLQNKYKLNNISLIYDRTRGYFSIKINSDNVNLFLNIVAPYIHPDFKYKLTKEFESTSFILYDVHYIKEDRLTENIIEENKILNETEKKKYSVGKYVYDIEVADNHNFFANDILTHNCQNCPWVLEDKSEWIASEKIDGTSTTMTLIKKGRKYEYYVCSRNVVFNKPDKSCYYDTNVYIEMSEKYNVENALKDILSKNNLEWVTLQGETFGAGVQKRDYGMKDHDFRAFNLIYSDRGRLNSVESAKIMEEYGIKWVPILDEHFILPDTVDELLNDATGESVIDGGMREGIVFRSLDGQRSFKAVSNEFLVKYHGG